MGFIALFSVGIYVWVNASLGQNYVYQVEDQVEQMSGENGIQGPQLRKNAAQVAADVALERFRNVLIGTGTVALCIISVGAYGITKRTLKPLAQTQERQKQFIANASHELRTPLAILHGEMELALNKSRSVDYYRAALIKGKQESERMIEITDQLLLLNQIDSQTDAHILHPEKISLNEVVQTACNHFEPLASKEHHRLVLDRGINPDRDKAYIRSAARLAETAVGNVIHNAIKYSSARGSIHIAVSQPTDGVYRLQVTNTCKTLTASEAELLFERFYQSNSNSSNEGFGLGLAITRSIMKLYDGDAAIAVHEGKVTLNLDFKSY